MAIDDKYLSVREAAEKWGVSERRVRMLCSEGRIVGTFTEGHRDAFLFLEEAVRREEPISERLLVNFILMRAGYLPISVKYEDRLAYYSAFTSYHRDHDAVPMTRIFLEAEKSRLQDWNKRI